MQQMHLNTKHILTVRPKHNHNINTPNTIRTYEVGYAKRYAATTWRQKDHDKHAATTHRNDRWH